MKVEVRYRPVDLARAAGVSAATVRMYEREGFFPPVERSVSGHRRYREIHLDALLTARAMMRGYGWAYARQVMRTVHGGNLAAALSLVDARHAELDRERKDIEATIAAFELATNHQGAHGSDDNMPAHMAPKRVGAAARWAGVEVSALRFWEAEGLLRPYREPRSNYRLYDREQLSHLRLIVVLRSAGYRVEDIRRLMLELQRDNPEAALAEVRKRQQQFNEESRDGMVATAALSGYLAKLETLDRASTRRERAGDG